MPLILPDPSKRAAGQGNYMEDASDDLDYQKTMEIALRLMFQAMQKGDFSAAAKAYVRAHEACDDFIEGEELDDSMEME